jgi:hypothetical protein
LQDLSLFRNFDTDINLYHFIVIFMTETWNTTGYAHTATKRLHVENIFVMLINVSGGGEIYCFSLNYHRTKLCVRLQALFRLIPFDLIFPFVRPSAVLPVPELFLISNPGKKQSH